MALNFLYIAHARFAKVRASAATCNFLRFCELNDIEVFQTPSAYEGLQWLRNNKADVIIVCLPTSDVVWSSFRLCASTISPSSYFVAVASHEGGPLANSDWTRQHGFSLDSEERIMKVKDSGCAQCVVIKGLCSLLSKVYGIEDLILPENVDPTCWDEAENLDNLIDLPQTINDLRDGMRAQLLRTRSSFMMPVDAEVAAASQNNSIPTPHASADVLELQARNHKLSELLQHWESQWDTLIGMLGVGISMGVSARQLYDHLLMLVSKSEVFSHDTSLPPHIIEFCKQNVALSHTALLDINSLYEALHSNSSSRNDVFNPSVALIDLVISIAQSRNLELNVHNERDGSQLLTGGTYVTKIHANAMKYTITGCLPHFSALILNLVLWVESNREVWNQARRRLNSLAGVPVDADNLEVVKVDLSVVNDALHIRISDGCALMCPTDFLGTPDAPGKVYSSLMLDWPNMPFSVWGLAYARAVVSLYQGTIDVANTEEGVVLELEMRDRVDVSKINAQHMYAEESALRLGRILFVDDEEKDARESIYALRKAGFEVIVCSRADSAMEAVEHHEFNAMVLDLNLPDRNGQDLYIDIVERYPKLTGRAIFVTGYLGTGHFIDSELRNFFAENHCKYLAKPYFSIELLRCINDVLSQRITPAAQHLSERVLK